MDRSLLRKEGGADTEPLKDEAIRKHLLILATLVASLTYTAVLTTPPGGFWQDEQDGHMPGRAVVKGRPHDARPKAFFVSNTMAFVASLVTLVILGEKKLLLWNYDNYGFMALTLLGLLAAYAAGSSRETDTIIYVCYLVGAVAVSVLVQVVGFVFLFPKNDNGRIDRFLPPSTIHPRVRDHLAAAFNLVLILVIFNSAMAIYLCRDDLLSVASITVSSVEVVLLFALHRRRGEPGHGGGSMLLKTGIFCLTMLLAVLLACKLVQVGAPSTPLLFAVVAGAMALGVGGCCAFLLHRQNRSKQPCQEVVITLLQDNL